MERKVILFIALSLDGFIADQNGGIDWLEENAQGAQGGYDEFIKDVDTILMGGITYRQIAMELSPEVWPYEGRKSYVFTRQIHGKAKDVEFVGEEPEALVRRLKKDSGKNIWICGGAEMAHGLVKANLIDEYYFTMLPILLGSGIRLFQAETPPISLQLDRVLREKDVITVVYKKR